MPLAYIFSSLALLACGSLPGTSDTKNEEDKATITTNFIPAGSLAFTNNLNLLNNAFGQAKKSEVKSLKYYLISIRICEDMTITGSGFSNPKNCLELFSKQDDDYESFDDQKARQDTSNYVDLMDPADVAAKLANTIDVSLKDAHAYKYGIINWMQPIKITAEIPLNDGTILYTKDGEVLKDDLNFKTVVNDITQAPAQEAIVRHNNGGAWFIFQNPFVITEDDVLSGNGFQLDMVFNPDKIIRGYAAEQFSNQGIVDSQTNHSIHVPLLGITPIVHSPNSKVFKESYLMRDILNQPFDLRLELYYVDTDQDKNILGADITTYFNELSSDDIPATGQIFSVSSSETGMSFNDYRGSPDGTIISEFKRLNNVGEIGSATFTSSFHNSQKFSLQYELLANNPLPEESTINIQHSLTSLIKARLKNTWKTNCYPNSTHHLISQISFDENLNFENTVDRFTDSACGSPLDSYVYTGTLSLEAGNPTKANFHFASSAATPKSASTATDFNNQGLCSKTDWQANTPKDTTGLICSGTEWVNSTDVSFEIIKVSGETLHIGGTIPRHSASFNAEDQRSTEFSANQYTKQ